MRAAYEAGFNVITLTDCCAATRSVGVGGAWRGGVLDGIVRQGGLLLDARAACLLRQCPSMLCVYCAEPLLSAAKRSTMRLSSSPFPCSGEEEQAQSGSDRLHERNCCARAPPRVASVPACTGSQISMHCPLEPCVPLHAPCSYPTHARTACLSLCLLPLQQAHDAHRVPGEVGLNSFGCAELVVSEE